MGSCSRTGGSVHYVDVVKPGIAVEFEFPNDREDCLDLVRRMIMREVATVDEILGGAFIAAHLIGLD